MTVEALQTKKLHKDHIVTSHTIVVWFDWGPPATILKSNDQFEVIKSLIEQGRFSELAEATDKALNIRRVTKGKFTVQNGVVVIDGEELPPHLSDTLIELVDKQQDTQRLENFWDNLKQNPTESARNDLFTFVEHNKIPITKDGCFVVYKKVRENYWDSHTGKTFYCAPGEIIEMPRDEVDHDRRNTCSAGCHVAAFEYAHQFFGTKLMECKVNPRDVVAVPPDYNNQKMRVCRAEVLRETNQKFDETLYDGDKNDGRLVSKQTTALISPDSQGRVRIPGRMVRLLGRGAGWNVEVCLENDGDNFLVIRLVDKGSNPHYYAVYTIQADNSIRISPTMLEQACLDWEDVEVVAEDGELIVQAA